MNFDEVIDRRASESVKWHIYSDDVLPLWIADMDYRCPEAIMEAIHERVNHGIFGYGIPPQDLPDIIVDRMNNLYGWHIHRNDVSFIPGCVTGINLAIRAFCNQSNTVLVQTPAYPPFLSAPASSSIERVDNPLVRKDDGSYGIDFNLFEDQIIKNRVKLFILCNPHNPVGRVYSKLELEQIAAICNQNNVIICSDDIHCDLIYSGYRHTPMASLNSEVASRTVTLLAPSKTYNIAGLFASVVIIQNEELKKKFALARGGLVSNPSVLSLTAARAAYLHGESWLKEALQYMEANRDWLLEIIPKALPGVNMTKPEGTYLAWLDCNQLNLFPDPHKFFLEHAKVGLNRGADFGDSASNFVRLNFGCTRATLEDAILRMHKALINNRCS